MKKHLFFLICLTITNMIQAQHCDSIDNHMAGHFYMDPRNAVQLSDGNLLFEVWLDSLTTDDYTQDRVPCLIRYYKVARHGAAILDSLTFEDTGRNLNRLMTRLHRTNGKYNNLMIELIRDESQSSLNLSFFDDYLVFNEEMEVTIPVADTFIYTNLYYNSTCILDTNDDIIFAYRVYNSSVPQYETHIARFGIDGTLKHEQVYSSNIVPISVPHGLTQNSDNPLVYNYFGYASSDCWGVELDSLFDIINFYPISGTSSTTSNSWYNGMASLGDGTACFVRDIRWKYFVWGTGIRKYDETGQILSEVWFQPCPRQYDVIKGIGMKRDRQGNVCYVFNGLDMDSMMYVAAVKVDEDLNVIWERPALRMQAPPDFHREIRGMRFLDDGGMLVFGQNHHYYWNYSNPTVPGMEPWLMGMFMVIFEDEIVNVPETEILVRPYLLYPNPVDDLLNIHYSPDITPSRIDLYDLQGRLVRTKATGFERLSLEGLAAGQYVLKVALENGKTYTDKVIKE